MNLFSLEEKIETIKGSNCYPIIELIISAVRDYPQYELKDTDDYFKEVKKLINSDEITDDIINKYLDQNLNNENEQFIWIGSSLSGLSDAFSLMKLYGISFDEVNQKIKELA